MTLRLTVGQSAVIAATSGAVQQVRREFQCLLLRATSAIGTVTPIEFPQEVPCARQALLCVL